MRILVAFLLFFSVIFSLQAEEIQKTKPRSDTLRLHPKNMAVQEVENQNAAQGPGNSQISFLIVTPLINETFPEQRFTAFGNLIQFSQPIWNISRQMALHVEGGAGVTLIRLKLSQPTVNFTHYYFLFPIHLRGIYMLNESMGFEIHLGLLLRPWEYDSRSTTDGGFHKVTSKVFNLDFGMGMTYALTPTFFFRLIVLYWIRSIS